MNVLYLIKSVINKYFVTLSLASMVCALFVIYGPVPESLYYNRNAVADNEIWRLITGHLVHSDLEHLLWNLCAFLILSLLIEQQSRSMLLIGLVTGTLVIDYYLWLNTIGVINYAGFSGVLNTLLVIALSQQNKQHRGAMHAIPVFIYFASLIKIIIELSSQQAIFSDISWQALPQVHLAGFVTGTLMILTISFFKNKTHLFRYIQSPQSSP